MLTKTFPILAMLTYPMIIVAVLLSGCAANQAPKSTTITTPVPFDFAIFNDECQCEHYVTITESTITMIEE